MGRTWIHAALEVKSRFLIDLRVGPRTTALAVALGLAREVWTVVSYVCHPVHVSDLQRDIWAEDRNAAQESALDHYFHKKVLPIS